jgi:hypothetical protein
MKKFFAILAITEIFIVIAWIITRLMPFLVKDVPIAVTTREVHAYIQLAVVIIGYVLSLHYLLPKMKKPRVFFAFITYLMLFGVLSTFEAGSLLAIWCYLKPLPHIGAVILTIIITVATAHTAKIYKHLIQ